MLITVVLTTVVLSTSHMRRYQLLNICFPNMISTKSQTFKFVFLPFYVYVFQLLKRSSKSGLFHWNSFQWVHPNVTVISIKCGEKIVFLDKVIKKRKLSYRLCNCPKIFIEINHLLHYKKYKLQRVSTQTCSAELTCFYIYVFPYCLM